MEIKEPHYVEHQQRLKKRLLQTPGGIVEHELPEVLLFSSIPRKEEVIGTDTIDQTPLYPRKVVKRELFHEAGAIILGHNHLSGNARASKMDIVLTSKIVETCTSVNITVHGHVIIAGNDYYSFKSNMLL